MSFFRKYEDDDCYDLSEFRHQKRRKSISCSDRMCGADDCETCRPGCTSQINNPNEDENDNDE